MTTKNLLTSLAHPESPAHQFIQEINKLAAANGDTVEFIHSALNMLACEVQIEVGWLNAEDIFAAVLQDLAPHWPAA